MQLVISTCRIYLGFFIGKALADFFFSQASFSSLEHNAPQNGAQHYKNV